MISVDEIRARLAAATPGPWRCYDHAGPWPVWRAGGEGEVVTEAVTEWSDAEFIAHAPDDVAWLLKENGRLRVTIEELVTIGRAKAGMVEDIRAALEGTDDE